MANLELRAMALEGLRATIASLATTDEFTPEDHDDAAQALDRLIAIAREIGAQS